MNEVADKVARHLGSGEVEAADALIASVAGKPVDHALGRAVLALYHKDPEAAIELATSALAAAGSPQETADSEHLLAAAYLGNSDRDEAIAHARKGVAADGSTKSRAMLGNILLGSGRFEDAASIYRQCASEEPKNFDYQLHRGIAATNAGDFGEAIESFARAFDANPADPRTVQHLMTMFAQAGRWLGAMAALDLSRRDNQPPEVSVLFDLASIHLVTKIAAKFPPAGVGEDPDNHVKRLLADSINRSPAVQLVAARTLVDVGRIDEATHLVDRLEKVQLETTDRATVLFLRGHIAERGKDRMNALTFYEQALAIDPTRADAAANAISVLLGDGSPTAFAKIEQILAKVPASHRSRPELVFNQAIYLVRSGKPAEGKAQLERLVAALPGDHPLGHLAKQAVLELSKSK